MVANVDVAGAELSGSDSLDNRGTLICTSLTSATVAGQLSEVRLTFFVNLVNPLFHVRIP